MRRPVLTAIATIGGIGLLLGLRSLGTADTMTAAAPQAASGTGTTGGAVYTGDTVRTRYGPVQVQVTIVDGRITAVDALQTPSGNATDRRIADHAVPLLTEEVLAAQSARVDAVSGATYTSEGYLQSLQSALDQAGV